MFTFFGWKLPPNKTEPWLCADITFMDFNYINNLNEKAKPTEMLSRVNYCLHTGLMHHL